ncbi:hypothetical protein BDW02DRAFT_623411 [Decorospora gaudefroyi]|uniref:Uncharacterized protein n=1 Tax=Decorospora gaudefroyi TaxID=184978 RepID=A0A6A5KBH7_9PLEO|nr:hypothetical protein BDW02DRAFT_623411 [Decorospora gaudefroyi]
MHLVAIANLVLGHFGDYGAMASDLVMSFGSLTHSEIVEPILTVATNIVLGSLEESLPEVSRPTQERMYHNLGHTPNWDTCFAQARLTEENLRLHSCADKKSDSVCQIACQMDDQQSWASITDLYYRYDGEYEESDEGDANAQEETLALRRAASLEVLKAYGGCFASGFLALQEPIPTRPNPKPRSHENANGFETRRWASDTRSIKTSSSRSSSNLNDPRPDSATLSCTDAHGLSKRGKWRWKGMKRSRKQAPKKLDV